MDPKNRVGGKGVSKEQNTSQIIRKDAKGCFVESLNDGFPIGKIHLTFATYDLSRPAGERQTNLVQIYLDCAELLELCRQAESGELSMRLQQKKQKDDRAPLYQCMGGTSAEKLQKLGRPRPDGKSLSRVFQLLPGSRADFLLVADSGPGEADEKGLIVPRFGKHPENHVVISMGMSPFCELILMTRAHYLAWLTTNYGKTTTNPSSESDEAIPFPESQEPERAMF